MEKRVNLLSHMHKIYMHVSSSDTCTSVGNEHENSRSSLLVLVSV